MTIYGEKCHRCGQKTRRIREKNPTCGHCISILDSRNEEIRKCPIDDTEMKKEIIHNIILDRCPECTGIWFDKNELESLEDLINQFSDDIMVHNIIKGISKGEFEE